MGVGMNDKRKTILIADDDPANLAVLDQIIGAEYRVVTAINGRGALEAARKHLPDLILLDVRMPDMDGFMVCRILKSEKLTAGIPLIFVSSLDDVCDEASGFAAGAVDYLVKPVSPFIVNARVRTHLSLTRIDELEKSYKEAVYMLGEAGHFNDEDTGLHIWRMGAYAAALARHLGWNADNCQLIELAAPMHDTGKLGIPDRILRKPGPLDNVEWELMKNHSRIGYEILSKSRSPLFQMAAEIALQHHEKLNGTGYPQGLCGDQIAESARIVAIADVFDALSVQRPYKAPWVMERIFEFLRQNRGTHFDPKVVDCFFDILPDILDLKTTWDNKELNQSQGCLLV